MEFNERKLTAEKREVARVRFAVRNLAPAECEGRIGVFFPFRGFDHHRHPFHCLIGSIPKVSWMPSTSPGYLGFHSCTGPWN